MGFTQTHLLKQVGNPFNLREIYPKARSSTSVPMRGEFQILKWRGLHTERLLENIQFEEA